MGAESVSTVIAVAIGIGMVYAFIKLLAGLGGRGGKVKHCMVCGVEAPTKSSTRGSMMIELVLWLCFIVPGLVYSLWRLSSRRQVCSSCGAETLIQVNSPAAVAHRKLLQQP